jgi:hypothetical protein
MPLAGCGKFSFSQIQPKFHRDLASNDVARTDYRMLKMAVSKAAGESKPEAYPRGYVEDFDELRTKLADFFSILIRR